MRISVDNDDPDWLPNHLRGEFVILLDGVEQDGVLIADDAKGEIVRIKCDENGHPVIVNDQFVHETLRGNVEIRVNQRWRRAP